MQMVGSLKLLLLVMYGEQGVISWRRIVLALTTLAA